MTRPLCFVLMPFGKKPVSSGSVVDFDAVYTDLIAPGIDQAGLDPLRADQELTGGIIHKPMFERLILCDFAVADLTSANANVFYELGIRHALRPATTAILFLEGTVIPFDIALVRGIPYRTDAAGEPVEPEIPAAAQSAGLARMQVDGMSPNPTRNCGDPLWKTLQLRLDSLPSLLILP